MRMRSPIMASRQPKSAHRRRAVLSGLMNTRVRRTLDRGLGDGLACAVRGRDEGGWIGISSAESSTA
jgi:hypothetical protein